VEIVWTQALLVSLVGFGSVFALLALLAVIVEITGRIFKLLPPERATPSGDSGDERAEITHEQRGGGL
jgi:Na+-transporting methylmalonyl-CoA/oxaloacetate decarboxylase gamma subunit